MFKRILKWFLIGGGVLLGIILIGVAAFLFLPRFDAISTVSFTLTPVAPCVLSPLPAMYPKIDRQPPVLDASLLSRNVTGLSHYDPASEDAFQVDVRQTDLSNLDLHDRLADVLMATFDDGTTWPPADRLPTDFDPQRSMELGKNPGLGVRDLHAAGITGRGVGIGIVDQTLLTTHQEYADRLQVYEETADIDSSVPAAMHGAAVTSIAAGKTVGVAPEADVYFIGTGFGNSDSYEHNDFAYLARGIRRLLEINESLPPDRKIRAISMSIGWDDRVKGYAELKSALDAARAAGILLVSTTLNEVYDFDLGPGLGRASESDPNEFASYAPGLFWASSSNFVLLRRALEGDPVYTPMDSRTTASPTDSAEYVFYRAGGMSWSVPYLAGMYALAAQVDPQITPERFLALALRTGRRFPYGIILDPTALIKAIQQSK
jgi:hypothetical protein